MEQILVDKFDIQQIISSLSIHAERLPTPHASNSNIKQLNQFQRKLPKLTNLHSPKNSNYINFANSPNCGRSPVMSPCNFEVAVQQQEEALAVKCTHKNPKVSRNLPAVFIPGTPLSVKPNKANKNKKVMEFSVDQVLPTVATEEALYTEPNTSRAFLSPLRLAPPLRQEEASVKNVVEEVERCHTQNDVRSYNRHSTNVKLPENQRAVENTPKPGTSFPRGERLVDAKKDDSSIPQMGLATATSATKKLIVFKKLLLKAPEASNSVWETGASGVSPQHLQQQQPQQQFQPQTQQQQQPQPQSQQQLQQQQQSQPQQQQQQSQPHHQQQQQQHHQVQQQHQQQNHQVQQQQQNHQVQQQQQQHHQVQQQQQQHHQVQQQHHQAQQPQHHQVQHHQAQQQHHQSQQPQHHQIQQPQQHQQQKQQPVFHISEELRMKSPVRVKSPTRVQASYSGKLKIPNFESVFSTGDENSRIVEKYQSISVATKIYLNELITLKKSRTTATNGIIKKMLYAPTFRIYDIQEESISELKGKDNLSLRDSINSWKLNFPCSKYVQKIYTSYWNSPEGCVSIVLEPSRRGCLKDILNQNGSLPEKCLQSLARDILKGLVEIHERLKKPHGSITVNDIILDENGRAKIAPNFASHANNIKDKEDIQDKFAKSKSPPNQRNHPLVDTISPNSKLAAENQINNQTSSINQDIFEFGILMLTCALGGLELYDVNNFYNNENLRNLKDFALHKKFTKQICCVLHDEDQLRKFLATASTTSSSFNGRKAPLTNNFSLKSPRAISDSLNKPSGTPVLQYLTKSGRFSENFIDFLCTCLKLDPISRIDAKNLCNHEFLSETHVLSGPRVSISEIVSLRYKVPVAGVGNGNAIGFSEKTRYSNIDKFLEGLKMVFMNKEVKDKFDKMLEKNGGKEIDNRRIIDLAAELDVDPMELWMRVLEDIIEASNHH